MQTPAETVMLKRFTSFDFAVGLGYLEVFVNPANVAYVQSRRRYDSKTDKHALDGTRIFFQQEAGVLDVREPIDEVIARLSRCNDCIFCGSPDHWSADCPETQS